MNNLFTKTALSAAITLSVVACGGSAGGIAGIGGSGFISSGSITGFGSVFVNGVEFETDSATFDVDGDLSGTQADLAIGMVVKVNGSINDDGITGIATSISFDDELQGPVTLLTAPDADGITRSFTVLGTTVIIDSGSTTFDVSGDISPAPAFDFNSIVEKNNVEISGFFNSAGELIATRVELKDSVFNASSIVEVKGTISGLTSTDFDLGNPGELTVDALNADFDDLPNGLADGLLVEVKGTFDTVRKILKATKIEAEDDSVDDTGEFELEGIITDYEDDSNFKINGISVDASNLTLSLSLANDLHVEVEGAIINGTLIATEIELEDGNIKVHAMVTAVPPATAPNTFEVSPVSGQPITITVSTDTQFENDVNEDKFFNLDKLVIDDFVEVQGFENDNGGISATEVEVKEASDVIVQGNLQDFVADNYIKVLGVTFTVNTGETKFEDTADAVITQDQFITAAPVGTLVKIEDKNDGSGVLGVADEIDIESP